MKIQVDDSVLSTIQEYFSNSQVVVYKKGQSILRAEDAPYGIYYLQKGYVRQYVLSPLGDQFMVYIYKPGSFFPLPWILNDTANTFHFEAMTNATIARGQKGPFIQFLHENPRVLYYAAQKLAAGMSGFVKRVGTLVYDDAFTKTVLLLLYFADIFGEVEGKGVRLTVPLTHREIASWIGTTRETASLQMEQLKKQGLITMNGRQIVLTDTEKLKELVVRQ